MEGIFNSTSVTNEEGKCINLWGINCNNIKKPIIPRMVQSPNGMRGSIKASISNKENINTNKNDIVKFVKNIKGEPSSEGILNSTSVTTKLPAGEISSNIAKAISNKENINTAKSGIINKSITTYPTGEGEYNEPNNLLNIESKHSKIVSNNISTSSKGNKFINDIKKYWWVGLLFVGHII